MGIEKPGGAERCGRSTRHTYREVQLDPPATGALQWILFLDFELRIAAVREKDGRGREGGKAVKLDLSLSLFPSSLPPPSSSSAQPQPHLGAKDKGRAPSWRHVDKGGVVQQVARGRRRRVARRKLGQGLLAPRRPASVSAALGRAPVAVRLPEAAQAQPVLRAEVRAQQRGLLLAGRLLQPQPQQQHGACQGESERGPQPAPPQPAPRPQLHFAGGLLGAAAWWRGNGSSGRQRLTDLTGPRRSHPACAGRGWSWPPWPRPCLSKKGRRLFKRHGVARWAMKRGQRLLFYLTRPSLDHNTTKHETGTFLVPRWPGAQDGQGFFFIFRLRWKLLRA